MSADLPSLYMTADHYTMYRTASLSSVHGFCPILSVHDCVKHSLNDYCPLSSILPSPSDVQPFPKFNLVLWQH